jgi:hypothetical protein
MYAYIERENEAWGYITEDDPKFAHYFPKTVLEGRLKKALDIHDGEEE